MNTPSLFSGKCSFSAGAAPPAVNFFSSPLLAFLLCGSTDPLVSVAESCYTSTKDYNFFSRCSYMFIEDAGFCLPITLD